LELERSGDRFFHARAREPLQSFPVSGYQVSLGQSATLSTAPRLDESAELVTERFTLDSTVQKSFTELFAVSTR